MASCTFSAHQMKPLPGALHCTAVLREEGKPGRPLVYPDLRVALANEGCGSSANRRWSTIGCSRVSTNLRPTAAGQPNAAEFRPPLVKRSEATRHFYRTALAHHRRVVEPWHVLRQVGWGWGGGGRGACTPQRNGWGADARTFPRQRVRHGMPAIHQDRAHRDGALRPATGYFGCSTSGGVGGGGAPTHIL